jgi:hypothetical protein
MNFDPLSGLLAAVVMILPPMHPQSTAGIVALPPQAVCIFNEHPGIVSECSRNIQNSIPEEGGPQLVLRKPFVARFAVHSGIAMSFAAESAQIIIPKPGTPNPCFDPDEPPNSTPPVWGLGHPTSILGLHRKWLENMNP